MSLRGCRGFGNRPKSDNWAGRQRVRPHRIHCVAAAGRAAACQVRSRVHKMTQPKQKGFTLVEIAVVLVIIGLLLGAILQGQALIQSARVNNLADQKAGIQAAYYGFIDRYGAVPGDMPEDRATEAIGEPISLGGNANGRLEDPSDSSNWKELNGVWEQLSKAGFISGRYDGAPENEEPQNADHAPENAFNGLVILAHHGGYTDNNDVTPERLLYHFGRNIPASIARELDVKLDNGQPGSGTIRMAEPGSGRWQSDGDCVSGGGNGNGGGPMIWDVTVDVHDCNPVAMF